MNINIQWEVKKDFNLTVTEYLVLERINMLSYSIKYDEHCAMSKENIAKSLDLSKKQVHRLINSLFDKNLLIKHKNGKWIKPVDAWRKALINIREKYKKSIILDENLRNKTYQEFLGSEYWHNVRKLVWKRDKYRCLRCESEKNLQTHHITYEHHFEEHLYLEDLETLCKDCHEKEHKFND